MAESESTPGTGTSRLAKLMGAMFPRTPNFYELLSDQCHLVVEAMEVFVAFMESGDTERAQTVRHLEHEGDQVKARNIDILNRSFSTPFDREDIYRSITTIDEGLNYAKTTVREMEILGVEPDDHMLEMAKLLFQGAQALEAGFKALRIHPREADRNASIVRKMERKVEKSYRRAIAELFDPEEYVRDLIAQQKKPNEDFELLLDPMENADCAAVIRGMSFVMDALKRREVYRHLSNASDHLAHAGDVLHDIVVKTA